MVDTVNYVYKKEIDWSVLMKGFTLPLENQVVFLQNMDKFYKEANQKLSIFSWKERLMM